MKKSKRGSIILAAFAGAAGGASPPPGGSGGNDRGGHGNPSGGGWAFYHWLPKAVRVRAARRLAELAEKLNPQVFAESIPSLPEVTLVQQNWNNQLYGFLRRIPPGRYVAFAVGSVPTYFGSRLACQVSNDRARNQCVPQITSYNNSLLNLSDRLRSTTTSTPPSELQHLVHEILTTELARNGAQALADEYNNPNWFVLFWQQVLSVPFRRGGPRSTIPVVAQIQSHVAEHFFSLLFPLLNHNPVPGNPIDPDWQAAAERLNRIVVPQFTASEVADVLNRTTVDRRLLNAILGLLFLLFPAVPPGGSWFLVLPYNEEITKLFSSTLWRYGVLLFIFIRSVFCYGVVLSVFSLLSYMMGLSLLSILSLFIEDDKLESYLEGFKSLIIGFIMLVTEIPLWVLAFTFVLFRAFLNKRKERVKKSFLNIKDQFNFFLTDNLNRLEEKSRADYKAEISFCL